MDIERVAITKSLLDSLAETVSNKSKVPLPLTINQMKEAVSEIEGGASISIHQDEDGYVVLDDEVGSAVSVTSLNVTENGTYSASTGVTYNPVTVNVAGAGTDAIIGRAVSGFYYNSTASYIGDFAFAYCNSLSSVTFTNVVSMGVDAFYSCTNLATANFPVATSTGDYTFAECYSLTTVSFSSATTIGANTFNNCTNLTTISFPNVTSIGSSAFHKCINLTTISFPHVTFIGSYAFSYCSSLTEASFPVASYVSNFAFYNCASITTVSFPTVTSIGAGAFRSCYTLESAYFLTSSVPTLSVSVFTSTPMSTSSYLGYFGSIFVKESLLASFQTATNWKSYSARMVGLTDAQIEELGDN